MIYKAASYVWYCGSHLLICKSQNHQVPLKQQIISTIPVDSINRQYVNLCEKN